MPDDSSPPPSSTPEPAALLQPATARRKRRLLYLGIGAVLTLTLVGTVVVAGRDGAGVSTSGCVTELTGHLPAETMFAQGSDLEAARAAGYDDSDLDALLEAGIDTGVIPDPITTRTVRQMAGLDDTPYDPGDVRCWAGDLDDFVARGSFDEQRVAASDLDLRLDGDLVTNSSPDADLLSRRTPPAALDAIITALADEGALSFTVTSRSLTHSPTAAERWAGVGLARSQSWDLVVAWSFPDDDAAATGEAAVVDSLTSDSAIPGLVDGDADEVAGAVERNGPVVLLRAPLSGEPHTWARPLSLLDPALLIELSD